MGAKGTIYTSRNHLTCQQPQHAVAAKTNAKINLKIRLSYIIFDSEVVEYERDWKISSSSRADPLTYRIEHSSSQFGSARIPFEPYIIEREHCDPDSVRLALENSERGGDSARKCTVRFEDVRYGEPSLSFTSSLASRVDNMTSVLALSLRSFSIRAFTSGSGCAGRFLAVGIVGLFAALWAASAYVLGGSEIVFPISSSLASIFVLIFNDHSLRYICSLLHGGFDGFYDCVDLSIIDFV